MSSLKRCVLIKRGTSRGNSGKRNVNRLINTFAFFNPFVSSSYMTNGSRVKIWQAVKRRLRDCKTHFVSFIGAQNILFFFYAFTLLSITCNFIIFTCNTVNYFSFIPFYYCKCIFLFHTIGNCVDQHFFFFEILSFHHSLRFTPFSIYKFVYRTQLPYPALTCTKTETGIRKVSNTARERRTGE